MAPNEDFKIIIAGGGIAGLTLANMLEKFDIQYVLLEAYSAIAPPVGASIGLFPNGLRILDQIGCYEAIAQLSHEHLNKGYTRQENGKIIADILYMFDHLERRFGYGLHFFDRQQLLQILYDHIQHKDRVLLNKAVTGIDLVKGGVNVTTADGSTYSGSIVVGADGIHSKVRSIMRALGTRLQPGYFDPDEEDRVPCYYRCSFGIAQHVPGWVAGEQNVVSGRGLSQLVVSGPDDRVYWFLFERLPTVKYGKDIPKYTTQDEAEFIKANASRAITEKVTFGQVFAKRLQSTLTPLHEVVFKKWFFKRIITFGDSAHKPNPLTGQGGNGAIESCAELVNAILRKRDSRGGSLDKLADEDILDIFTETQSARHERAEMIVREAHKRQAIDAYEDPITSTIIQTLIMPQLGNEYVFNRLGKGFTGASKLEYLPVPHRARAVPFADELPAKPVPESVSSAVRWGFVGGMGLVLVITKKAWRLPFSRLGGWGESGSIVIPWLGGTPASQFLKALVSIFSYPLLDKDPSVKWHLINFLPQLISPILIYTIEGYRLGNQGSLLALPSLFTAGMQVQGIGRIGPLYAILSAVFGTESIPGRTVPKEVAMSLVPAVTLGFALPTIMSLWPTANVRAWQHWVALWQFAPPLVNVLTALFSTGLRRLRQRRSPPDEHEKEFERYKKRDVPVLQRAYMYAFAVQSTVHIATMAYAWSHPDISIAKTFFGLPNPFKAEWNLPSLSQQLATFFRYDAVTALAAYVGGNLYSVWELRRLGYIKTRSALKAALAVMAGQVLVGPGATWAALWSWREGVIADLSQ